MTTVISLVECRIHKLKVYFILRHQQIIRLHHWYFTFYINVQLIHWNPEMRTPLSISTPLWGHTFQSAHYYEDTPFNQHNTVRTPLLISTLLWGHTFQSAHCYEDTPFNQYNTVRTPLLINTLLWGHPFQSAHITLFTQSLPCVRETQHIKRCQIWWEGTRHKYRVRSY